MCLAIPGVSPCRIAATSAIAQSEPNTEFVVVGILFETGIGAPRNPLIFTPEDVLRPQGCWNLAEHSFVVDRSLAPRPSLEI